MAAWRASSLHHRAVISNLAPPWPSLMARSVVIGGVTVAFADAEAAVEILVVSRTSAIMPVLRAAGNPLAGCDYFGVSAPYVEWAKYAPKTGRVGAGGRHVTKVAFVFALQHALEQARREEVAAGIAAFAADERYAVAIAREAVGVRERARAAGVRAAARAAAVRAVSACCDQPGEFTCAERSACGSGGCRFAAPAYRLAAAPAGPGRFTRPPNHVRAGSSFTESASAAQVLAGGGHVAVYDADAVATSGWAA
jgi:hypothetical protein